MLAFYFEPPGTDDIPGLKKRKPCESLCQEIYGSVRVQDGISFSCDNTQSGPQDVFYR